MSKESLQNPPLGLPHKKKHGPRITKKETTCRKNQKRFLKDYFKKNKTPFELPHKIKHRPRTRKCHMKTGNHMSEEYKKYN